SIAGKSDSYAQAVNSVVSDIQFSSVPFPEEIKRDLSEIESSIDKSLAVRKREIGTETCLEAKTETGLSHILENHEHSVCLKNTMKDQGSNFSHDPLHQPGLVGASVGHSVLVNSRSKTAVLKLHEKMLPKIPTVADAIHTDTLKTDQAVREISEFEIKWEDMVLIDRIGQGSMKPWFKKQPSNYKKSQPMILFGYRMLQLRFFYTKKSSWKLCKNSRV
ncbi:hypothetical protein KI387_016392, partial [Taxus chinensis]